MILLPCVDLRPSTESFVGTKSNRIRVTFGRHRRLHKLGIDRILQLTHNRTVVDTWGNLMNCDSVFNFIVLERPIYWRYAAIFRQRPIVHIDDPSAFVNKPRP